MFNYRTFAVFKREVKEKVLSKTFIFMTILLPVLMFGIIGLQTLLMSQSEDSGATIELITETNQLAQRFMDDFPEINFVKNGDYKFSYWVMPRNEFEEYLNSKKNDLISERITGIIFVPESALKDKEIEYYAKTPKNLALTEKLSGPINKVLVECYFADKKLSKDELNFARMSVDFTSFKVSEKAGIEEEGYGNLVLSYLFTFLLYISLLMMGQMTMQSVIEEKNSKIVEVLLSSVSSKELMTGKILGASVTGTIQMSIWLLPIILLITTTWFVLPPEYLFSITPITIIYLLINFFIGLITFLGLFAAVGAIFESQQEAQSGMWPIMLLIIIPFFIAMTLIVNPTNPIAAVCSFLPFTSIIVMPAKIALVEVPLWQLFLTILINIATIFAIFPLAGKIYRVGILRTGKKPTWGEVVKWLKYKY